MNQEMSPSVSHSKKVALPVVVALAFGLAVGVGVTATSGRLFGGTGVTFAVAPNATRAAEPVLPTMGFAPMVKEVLPAVVNVSSSKVVKVRNNMPEDMFGNDPLFQQFFGGQQGRQFNMPQQEREHSLGSGVIVNKDGYILTNNHVVEGASSVSVDLSDKRHFIAKVVGTDPQYDIAVLKIDATNLPTLQFGDSKKLEIGDYVLAIGDPFGIGETVTMGIVSATGRSNVGVENNGAYEDFIQTDAAINPGNSGGALVDARGDLVGINTAIASSSGGNEGIGFAIPINMARSAMTQIIEHGKVSRGYLGVVLENMTPALAKQFNVPNTDGGLIGQVDPGTPAAKAGLQRGDVIIGINGEAATSYNDLRLRIAQAAPNTTINLKISRNGHMMDVPVTVAEQPKGLNAPPSDQDDNDNDNSADSGVQGTGLMSGVHVQNLTPQIIRELNLPAATRGVVVTQVASDSAAADALTRGNVILEVNHQPVHDVQEYQQAISHSSKDSVLLLVMDQQGRTAYVAVTPQQ
jgi:serine protease Do